MARYAWFRELKPGCEEEYTRRHAELWPEMKEAIHGVGIRDYVIFLHGTQVFGTFECDDLEVTREAMKSNPAMHRWQQANQHLFLPRSVKKPGDMPLLTKVFDLP